MMAIVSTIRVFMSGVVHFMPLKHIRYNHTSFAGRLLIISLHQSPLSFHMAADTQVEPTIESEV
jgi:hypothetical protein